MTNQNRYLFNFSKHVNEFCDEFSLLEDKTPVIALSGGLDSVALLHLFNDLSLQNLCRRPRAVTIDHGTRADIEKELRELKKICDDLKVEYRVLKIKALDLSSSNFENVARQSRYEAIENDLKADEVCLLGHHLDDCFEWSLMQQFKSSQMSAKLGIPVRRGVFRRPLLCVSRAHIERYAKYKNLKWFEDSSNTNLKFERNFIRHEVVKSIAKRYPKYLKHYVYSQKELKKLLKAKKSKEAMPSIKSHQRSWGMILEIFGALDIEQFKSELFKVSQVHRGQVALQSTKFVTNFNKGNLEIKGPYSFSGGVKVFQFGRQIIFIRKNFEVTPLASQIPDSIPFLSRTSSKNSMQETPAILATKYRHLLGENPFTYPWKEPRGQVLIYI